MICPHCGNTLSGKDVTCTCKRKRYADELFQRDKRFIVETKTETINVDEKTENEQTEISYIKPNKRNYGTGKPFTKKDVFPD
jgi:hypothetical protein